MKKNLIGGTKLVVQTQGEALWLNILSISQIGFLPLKTFKVLQHAYWYMFFSADCGGKHGCTLLFVSLEAMLSQISSALFLLWFIPAIMELLGWHLHVFVSSSPSFLASHWTSKVSDSLWDEDSTCVLSPGVHLVLTLFDSVHFNFLLSFLAADKRLVCFSPRVSEIYCSLHLEAWPTPSPSHFWVSGFLYRAKSDQMLRNQPNLHVD